MVEPPMGHERYQQIVDQRLDNWQLTEEEFIASSLYFDWRDIFGGHSQHAEGPRYFPRWLRQGISDEAFWLGWVEYITLQLRCAYQDILARHQQETGRLTQAKLFGEPAA